ncbi:MAG: DEAD/DEAH box helicase, partial [Rhodobacteraceae bacterium]
QSVVMFRASRRDREGTEKRALLRAMIEAEGEACTNAIIFCNRKTEVDILAKSLKKYGLNAAPIHGDLDQSQRMRTLDGFRDGTLRFLVASDVAARGLDIPNVSHVINYDVPGHPEDYVHRIGRTGRAGRKGTALMICTPRDEKQMAAIEALIQTTIPRAVSPLGENAAAEAEDDAPAREARGRADKPRRERGPRREDDRKPRREAGTSDEAPRVEETGRDARPAEERKPEARKQDDRKQDDRRQDDRTQKSRGPRREDGAKPVVGMGDHLPGFIALSFEDRRGGN